ncbi:MAG: phosphodiesterase [Roseovarius sp.]
MTRLLQISDSHIVRPGRLAYGVVDTASALADTVSTINRMLERITPVEMVLVTGDLTDFGQPEEYARFREIMADLTLPYRVIPGNHDSREALRTAFAGEGWMPARGPINWRADLGGLTLLALDSGVEGAPHGTLEPATLAWLDAELRGLGGRPVLVACHHPPVDLGLPPMDRQRLMEPGGLRALLDAYEGPKRLLCGHVHRFMVAQFGTTPVLSCPGTSHAVTLDMREQSPNSLTLEPGGMLLHDYREGFVSQLVPVGDFAGGYPFETPPA